MGYSGPYTLSERVGAEIVGSIFVYLLAVGVAANALLPKAKGQGMGFLAIAIAAGLGITLPIITFQQVSGWFNPSFLLALWVRGQLSAGDFFALFAADMVGYFIGAVLLWLVYLPHFNCAVDPPACTEVERLLTDPALLTQPALLNASYGLGAPRITSLAGLWAFFLGELRTEVRKVAHAQRVTDPLSKCTASQRAVHASLPSLARTPHPSPGGGTTGSDPDLESPPGSLAVPLQPQPGSQLQTSTVCKLGSACEELEAPGGFQEGHAGGHGTRLKGGSKPGSLDEDLVHDTLGDSLRAEANPRLRVVMALTKARQDVVLSVFATRPAVFSPFLNLVQEFVSTGLLVTLGLMVIEQARFLGGELPTLWASQSALYAGLTQTVVILALGGPTGPAMNAARDTAPRLAHQLLPIPGKGCSEWYYGWVPFVGTLAGGAAAGSLVDALVRLLKLG